MRAQIRILHLEDNSFDADLVQVILRRPEYLLERVGTLAEAVLRMAATRYHVVLVDLGLPDSSGLETYQRIRALTDGAVLIVSASMRTDVSKTAMNEELEDKIVTALVRNLRERLDVAVRRVRRPRKEP